MHFIKLMHSLKQVLYSFAAIISFFLCLSVILPISKAHIKFYTESTTEENVPSDINKKYIGASFQDQIIEIFNAFVIAIAIIVFFFGLTLFLIAACEEWCPDCITPIIEYIDGLGHRLRNHFRRLFRVRREPHRPPHLNVYFNGMRHSSNEEVERY